LLERRLLERRLLGRRLLGRRLLERRLLERRLLERRLLERRLALPSRNFTQSHSGDCRGSGSKYRDQWCKCDESDITDCALYGSQTHAKRLDPRTRVIAYGNR